MWEVYEHRRAAKRLDLIPEAILKRYEKWKDIVRISGPAGLRLIKGFHDEGLHAEWKGHRSSRFGDQYRVLYQIKERSILVIDVTAHDYRRKS
jgi:mRNA-degrading endonuclease RelE of RelBE toxin-antitoxin system